jgi:hypothetical protein
MQRLEGLYETWLRKDRDVQENRVCEKWKERGRPHVMPQEKDFKRNTFSAKFADLEQ